MRMSDDMKLHSRFRNCLNTIFELEEQLRQSEVGEFLQKEFVALKEASERVELDNLSNGDVELIEKATERLMRELYLVGTNIDCGVSQHWNIH